MTVVDVVASDHHDEDLRDVGARMFVDCSDIGFSATAVVWVVARLITRVYHHHRTGSIPNVQVRTLLNLLHDVFEHVNAAGEFDVCNFLHVVVGWSHILKKAIRKCSADYWLSCSLQ